MQERARGSQPVQGLIAAHARVASVDARREEIFIEACKGDDLIIAPGEASGNLIFRTMLLLFGAASYGARCQMEKVFVGSSRAQGDFKTWTSIPGDTGI